MDEDCTKTLLEISTEICAEFQVSFSETSIYRYLKGFNYSFKRLSIFSVRRNTIDKTQLKQNHADWFIITTLENPSSKVFLLDKMGFKESIRSSYGRAPVGVTPTLDLRSIRTKKIYMCAIYSKINIEYFEIENTAYNTEKFE